MRWPQRYLTRMALFLAIVLVVAAALMTPLKHVFAANPALNGLIVGVAVLGVIYIFRQVFSLRREVAWLADYQETGQPPARQPRLLAPMATMLGERSGRFSLSALSARSLLDSISARLDESRDLARYLIGLMIFLGLLGTFWGLLQTVSSIGATIHALDPTGGDFARLFTELKEGLQRPLAGMGTAFSSSLLGLASSLVLGFLDLQAGQAQNRFYNDLEEWLASLTRLGSGGLISEGEASVPAYVQALLEQTADSLENLQRTMARSEESRSGSNTALTQLADRLATFTDQMRASQDLMVKLAENQIEMRPVLARLAGLSGGLTDGGGMDAASRAHLRNIDVYVGRLLEESAEGRSQMLHEIRSEIKLLARTIAALADERGRSG